MGGGGEGILSLVLFNVSSPSLPPSLPLHISLFHFLFTRRSDLVVVSSIRSSAREGGREGGSSTSCMSSSRRSCVVRSSQKEGEKEGRVGRREGGREEKRAFILLSAGDVEEGITLGAMVVDRALKNKDGLLVDLLSFSEPFRGSVPHGAAEGVSGRLATGKVRCVFVYIHIYIYICVCTSTCVCYFFLFHILLICVYFILLILLLIIFYIFCIYSAFIYNVLIFRFLSFICLSSSGW